MPGKSQTPPAHDNSGGRPAKRKRVALACETCRDRKIRCDGGKPRCQPCTKRGESSADCVYSVIASSAKQISEQEYIASLQRQVRDLNHVVGSLRGSTRSQDAGSPESNAPARLDWGSSPTRRQQDEGLRDRRYSMASESDNVRQQEQRVSASRGGGEEINARPGVREDDGPSPVNAMGASISVRSPGMSSHHDEFYGQSSVHSLLQEVSKTTGQKPKANFGPSIRQRPSREPDLARSRPSQAETANSLLQPRYALPPRAFADQLIGLYFDNINIFYPWTHYPSFHSRFESLWSRDGYQENSVHELGDIGLGGDKCPLPVFYCAVNAMFALGCEFSDFPDKESASATFYGRLRDLLQGELLDHSSISHVQVLQLVSHYLLTTQYPTQCYNMIGLACRMAVALGLHVEKPSPKRSDIETQIRRRVWHGCFQLEMFVSMTLGRPSMMVNDDVPLPAAIDDEYLSAQRGTSEQPSGVISQNWFNVENIKVIRILGMILRRIYHPPPEDPPAIPNFPDLSTLLDFDSMLQKAKEKIPPSLNWDCPPNESLSGRTLILRRQANVLRARFLHLRILLYRPSFTAFCAAARPTPSRQEHTDYEIVLGESDTLPAQNGLPVLFRAECATVCVKTACELIESVARATDEAAAGAWWFSLFYLVTSGVIIILAECTQLQRQSFDEQMLANSWELCNKTLQQLSMHHVRAQEYLQSLRALRERALLTYGNAPDDADAAAVGQTEQLMRPGVNLDDTYNTYADAQQNANAAWSTGFLEHDWGVPLFLENWGEIGIESYSFQSGGYQVDGGV